MKQSNALCALALALAALHPSMVGAQQYDSRGNIIPGTEPPPKIDKIPKERLPERDVPPPPAPRPENLMRLDVPHFPGKEVQVDRAAFSVGVDEIVRYTVIATSANGLTQVSYEGIRCGPDEWRSYFVGRPDGTWTKDFTSRWQRVSDAGPGAIRFLLAKAYFCTPQGKPVATLEEVFDRLTESSVMQRPRER
jgi:hypothetical protein